MTTEETEEPETQPNIDAITEMVFGTVAESGAKGVSAILAALVTVAQYTENTDFLAELLDITKDILTE